MKPQRTLSATTFFSAVFAISRGFFFGRLRADVEDPRARGDPRLAAARGTPRGIQWREARQRLPRRRAAEDRREAAARTDVTSWSRSSSRRAQRTADRRSACCTRRRRVTAREAREADPCARSPSPTTATSRDRSCSPATASSFPTARASPTTATRRST